MITSQLHIHLMVAQCPYDANVYEGLDSCIGRLLPYLFYNHHLYIVI
jgi:hypothetical protein